MSRETKEIIIVIAILIFALIGLKWIQDYSSELKQTDNQIVKKIEIVGKTKKKPQKEVTKVVTNLSDSQKSKIEKEKSKKSVLSTKNDKNKNNKEPDSNSSHENNTDAPQQNEEEQFSNPILKEQYEEVLTFFPKEIIKRTETKCATVTGGEEKALELNLKLQETEDSEWRIAQNTSNSVIDRNNYSNESITLKFPFQGGKISGTYTLKSSSSDDFDLPVMIDRTYNIEGEFEGGDGGKLVGRFLQASTSSTDRIFKTDGDAFYGTLCAIGNGMLILRQGKSDFKSFPLSFTAFPDLH